MKKTILVFLIAFWAVGLGYAQRVGEPSQSYILPEVLEKIDGSPVTNAQMWTSERRPEILQLFREEVYGITPSQTLPLTFINKGEEPDALNGTATRKQIRIQFGKDPDQYIDLLLYLPNHLQGPVPVFLGLNFAGNQTIHPDPSIMITEKWMPAWKDPGIVNHRSNEVSRGTRIRRWPVDSILRRGYGLATFYYGDVFPDKAQGASSSIQMLFNSQENQKSGSEWGAIGAWAWGLSRAMDYLITDPTVASDKVVVMGHSRLGKASLWAGAQDQRFAMVISNDSGEGGAALSRRKYGERIKDLNKNFPHWFAANFKNYDEKEQQMPVDFHMLLSLIAPRPLYVASASEDQWADPEGEYLSARNAVPVYELLGHKVKLGNMPPRAMNPIGLPGKIGYHMRHGKHDILAYDWEQFLNFADYHFGKSTN
ncbi:alpha/beta hydrolase family protein [Dyadobacter tibetensis]|uniref:alpha/beta hydrolase family protein n=1 Tax=Dyadobacter tibetensis TaxID=1211851 RepID=UPI000471B799|nr:hypothetical protein [Dyadobacter tibetensis]